MKVTGIDKLREMAKGEVVALSPFITGEEFNVRLKRPSLYDLALKGTIPNPLLNQAAALFNGDKREKAGFKETAELLHIVAECALAEPTYAQLDECGVNLTDLQLMEIFNYTQTGIIPLSNFRDVPADHPGAESEPAV